MRTARRLRNRQGHLDVKLSQSSATMSWKFVKSSQELPPACVSAWSLKRDAERGCGSVGWCQRPWLNNFLGWVGPKRAIEKPSDAWA